MTKKAKKKIHPMPKLGWKDQLLYLSVLFLTGGFPFLGWFLVLHFQTQIAFADPRVIAGTVGQGNMLCVWLMLWCLIVFILVYSGPYHNRYPIFGRSDIKYGPPAYPRVYPLLMRNKPKYWVSPKYLQKKKRLILMCAVILVITFLLCIALFSLSFFGRAVLTKSGEIIVYDEHNTQTHHYSSNEITSVELKTGKASGRFSGSWYIFFVIHTNDSETYSFSASSFPGTDLEQLQAMLTVKEELYSDRILISGGENLQNVIRDQYSKAEEQVLLRELFNMSP